MNRLSTRAGVAAFVLVASLGACSSDDDPTEPTSSADVTSSPASVETTSSEPPGTSDATTTDGFSVSTMLEQVPLDLLPDEFMYLTMGDLDIASELAGVERPSQNSPGDIDALLQWLNPISGFSPDDEVLDAAVVIPQAVGYENLRSNAEIAEEFGWSVLDVHSFVELINPPAMFAVLEVDVTGDDLSAAIPDEEGGIWRLGGEDGSQDLRNRTAGRPLGESVRFGLANGLLAMSKETPPVEAWLSGDGPSLADDEQLRAIAEALDSAGAYSAMIIDAEPHRSNEQDPETTGELLLSPFDVLGAGLASADGKALGILVYQHDDAAAAAANEDAVRAVFEEGQSVFSGQPLRELLELEDVVVDGPTIVATFRILERSPRMIWQMVIGRDLPATHR